MFQIRDRADNRRFPILSLPHRPVLRRGTIITIWVFFSTVALCPSLIMGLFFNDRCVLSSYGRFFDPHGFPRDQRGRSWSRNRGLRFGIRADSGRVRQKFLLGHLCPFLRLIFQSANLGRVVGGLFFRFHWESARILKVASAGSSGGGYRIKIRRIRLARTASIKASRGSVACDT